MAPALAIGFLALGPASAAEPVTYNPADFPFFELTPQAKGVFATGGHPARMAYNYLRYSTALIKGGDALDSVVSPDVILNDLKPMGFSGLPGLKEFRRQSNAAMTYDRALLIRVAVPQSDITDIDLCTERTAPQTGKKAVSLIHARDRWASDKVVERWHQFAPQDSAKNCDEVALAAGKGKKP